MTSFTHPDLLILSAGTNSRFGGESKFLKVSDQTFNVLNEVDSIDNVFVVVPKQHEAKYVENCPQASILPITPGSGSGYSILRALQIFGRHLSDDVILLWGDAYLTKESVLTIEKLANKNEYDSMVFPMIFEENPYVEMEGIGTFISSCKLSKYGDRMSESGFKDQCIFRAKKSTLIEALTNIEKATLREGKYLLPGGEFEFLHILHYLWNSGTPAEVYLDANTIHSFNTLEELAKLKSK